MNFSSEAQEVNSNIAKYLEDPDTAPPEDNLLLKQIHSFSKEQFLELIFISSACERFDDVLLAFEMLFTTYHTFSLTTKERSALEAALKNTVGLKQKKLNKLETLYKYSLGKANDLEDFDHHQSLLLAIKAEKERISRETVAYVRKVLHLIEEYIMKAINATGKGIDREAEVFYFRMKGDSYKYLSQVEAEDMRLKMIDKAKECYNDAYRLGGQFLPISNKTFLATALSYANFLLFFMKSKKDAEAIIQRVLKNKFIEDVLTNTSTVPLDIFDIVKEIYDLNEALANNAQVLMSEADEDNETDLM